MSFDDAEIAHLRSQPLARVATLGGGGQPDVVPVAYEFDGAFFWVGAAARRWPAPARSATSPGAACGLAVADAFDGLLAHL